MTTTKSFNGKFQDEFLNRELVGYSARSPGLDDTLAEVV